MSLAELAAKNVRDTLAIAMDHKGEHPAIVVADERTELSRLLFRAYSEGLPTARLISFDQMAPEAVKAELEALEAQALVVLVQSSVLRMPEFRTRVELYRRGVKVIEHSNLERMEPHELEHYVAAMAYDPAYYRGIGHALKARVDLARSARIESEGETLHYGALEEAKLNIGDFAGLKNVGSQFPIGEVFTEARELESVHGRTKIYGFADTAFKLNLPPEPITLVIEAGRIVDTVNSTSEFDQVLALIREGEGEVWVRELGFGMNRAFSRERTVADVGAFERVCGVHLSLGARHGVYKKPQLNHRENRYHVDSFVITDRVLLDEAVVYDRGEFLVAPTAS